MRVRSSSREMVFTYSEFQEMSVGELCRRYGWGDWLDLIRDEQAEKVLLQET